MPEGGKPYPGERRGGLTPNKAQAGAMQSMAGDQKNLGWLLDFIKGGIMGPQQPPGQAMTPQQQPMGTLAVPMPQVPMPKSPMMPQVPGMGGGMMPQGQLQNVVPPQQASGAPQQGAVQQGQNGGTGADTASQNNAGGQGGGGNILETILKIVSMIGGK